MEFSKPIMDLIRERTSRRTYSGQPLEKNTRQKIIELIKNLALESPFNRYAGNPRFELVSVPEFDPKERKKLGTYGLIKGAQDFIVGAIEKSKFDREHFGYLFETIILSATDMGLGTCWLGGFFNRSLFAEKIKSTPNEIVPAITPIGEFAKRTLKEKAIRSFVKANKRLPWDQLFFKKDFENPLSKEDTKEYSELLEMVRIGPSAGNKQPWRIVKELNENIFHFFVVKSDSVYDRFRPLDIGIAVCHFDLSVKELGIKGNWTFEEPQILVDNRYKFKITWNEIV